MSWPLLLTVTRLSDVIVAGGRTRIGRAWRHKLRVTGDCRWRHQIHGEYVYTCHIGYTESFTGHLPAGLLVAEWVGVACRWMAKGLRKDGNYRRRGGAYQRRQRMRELMLSIGAYRVSCHCCVELFCSILNVWNFLHCPEKPTLSVNCILDNWNIVTSLKCNFTLQLRFFAYFLQLFCRP